MASPTPLQGIELINCAKANAKQGIETTAQLCGYGANLTGFEHHLKKACQNIGVDFHTLSDLITDQQILHHQGGIEVAPDTLSNL